MKQDELQAVLSGQAVPVATRGVFTLADTAVKGTLTPGSSFGLSSVSGFIASTNSPTGTLGLCLASGSRTAIGTADQFAGAAGSTGNYYVVKINL